MSKSYDNYIGVTERPEEMYGKTLSIPDASLADWYSLLLGGGPGPGSEPPRRQAGTGAGAGRALSRRAGRRRSRGALRPGPRPTTRPPADVPEVPFAASRRHGAPAGAARRRLRRSRPRRPGEPRPGRGPARRHPDRGRGARPAGRRARRPGAPARQAALCPRPGRLRWRPGSGAGPPSTEPVVTVHGGMLALETPGDGEIVDITAGVRRVVETAGVERGVVTVFVVGSTAAVTTMEYEPGGVADLQRAAGTADPRARGLRAQPAQPRHQLPRPPARRADRALGVDPARRRPPQPGNLAADRPARLRRRPRHRTVTVQVRMLSDRRAAHGICVSRSIWLTPVLECYTRRSAPGSDVRLPGAPFRRNTFLEGCDGL